MGTTLAASVAVSGTIPWIVAEAVALRVARAQAGSVIVHGDPSGRLLEVCAEAAPERGPLAFVSPAAPEALADALVIATDGSVPGVGARALMLELAPRCRSELVVCEPHAPGHGLGLETLRRLDPGFTRLSCDELPDRRGGTRTRKAWEAPQDWFVASAAAWRFALGAEELRASLRTRLPQMRADQMLLACRRILARHPTAYELLALAAEELARRGDRDGVSLVRAELTLTPSTPGGIRARVRRAAVACAKPRAADAVSA